MESHPFDVVSLREHLEEITQIKWEQHLEVHKLEALALTKAEEALIIKLSHMNEFREQIEGERGGFVTRKEFITAIIALLSIEIALVTVVVAVVIR